MPSEMVIELLTPLLIGALGTLFWARLNRLEAGLDSLRIELSDVRERMATRDDIKGMATRDDIKQVRAEMNGIRGEMGELRGEMGGLRGEMSGLRGEMAVMRSDLTHVALAVGANRPKPAEGETSAN